MNCAVSTGSRPISYPQSASSAPGPSGSGDFALAVDTALSTPVAAVPAGSVSAGASERRSTVATAAEARILDAPSGADPLAPDDVTVRLPGAAPSATVLANAAPLATGPIATFRDAPGTSPTPDAPAPAHVAETTEPALSNVKRAASTPAAPAEGGLKRDSVDARATPRWDNAAPRGDAAQVDRAITTARPMAHPTGDKAPPPVTPTLVLDPDAAPAEPGVLPGVLAAQMVATPPARTPPSPMPQDEPPAAADAVAAVLVTAAGPALLHPSTLPLAQLPSQQPAAMLVRTGLAVGSTHPARVSTKAGDDGAITEQDGPPDPVSRDAEAMTGSLELPLAPALAAASTAAMSVAAAATPPVDRAASATPPQAERPDGRRGVVGAKAPSRAGTAAEDREPSSAIDRVAAETAPDPKASKAFPADSADTGPAPALSIPTAALAPADTSLPKAIAQDVTPGEKQLTTGAPAEPLVVARPGQIGHEVGVEIARRVSAGGDELVVRLVPAELGRIEVRMSFDERGGLRAVIAADSPVALDMLRRDSADLSRSLSDAGVRSDAQSLRFQTDGGSGGGTNQHRTPWLDAEPRTARGARVGSTDDIDLTPYRQLRTSGRYDLLA